MQKDQFETIKFFKEWSVGRMIIIFICLYIFAKSINLSERTLLYAFFSSIGIEIFELSLNGFKESKCQRLFFCVTGILFLSFCFYDFSQNRSIQSINKDNYSQSQKIEMCH